MVNQALIAKKAGVSISMVSRVLSGWADSGGVAKANAEKIRRIASQLGYRPNLAGRMLRTNKSKTVGLLFSSQSHLYRELVPDLQKRLFAHGYSAVCGFWNTADDADAVIGALSSGWVDGVIAGHPPAEMQRLGVQAPTIHFIYDARDRDCVIVDKADALRKVIGYLTSLGHNRMLFLGSGMQEGGDMLGEYRAAGLVAGVYDWKSRFFLPAIRSELVETLRTALSRPDGDRPTALVCGDDAMAVLCVTILQNMGKRVPGDLSVVGAENLDIGQIAMPAITTCGPHREKIADALVNTLLARLDKPESPPRRIILPSEVIVRESTGPRKAPRPTRRF